MLVLYLSAFLWVLSNPCVWCCLVDSPILKPFSASFSFSGKFLPPAKSSPRQDDGFGNDFNTCGQSIYWKYAKQRPLSSQVIGGINAEKHEFPFASYIITNNSKRESYFCGAVIINGKVKIIKIKILSFFFGYQLFGYSRQHIAWKAIW